MKSFREVTERIPDKDAIFTFSVQDKDKKDIEDLCKFLAKYFNITFKENHSEFHTMQFSISSPNKIKLQAVKTIFKIIVSVSDVNLKVY